jgi:hypothetical protein
VHFVGISLLLLVVEVVFDEVEAKHHQEIVKDFPDVFQVIGLLVFCGFS